MENNSGNNILANTEKPHFTREERILYYKSWIAVAEENNLTDVANHYKI